MIAVVAALVVVADDSFSIEEMASIVFEELSNVFFALSAIISNGLASLLGNSCAFKIVGVKIVECKNYIFIKFYLIKM